LKTTGRILGVVIFGLSVGCQSDPAPAPEKAPSTTPEAPPKGASPSPEDARQEPAPVDFDYLILATGKMHPASSGSPQGLYIKGKIENGQFIPEGDIQGDGPLGDVGSPGWMELRDGGFHGEQTSRPPFPPFVKGFMTKDGEFRPSTRTVTY
jgi:hypothetical protein